MFAPFQHSAAARCPQCGMSSQFIRRLELDGLTQLECANCGHSWYIDPLEDQHRSEEPSQEPDEQEPQ